MSSWMAFISTISWTSRCSVFEITVEITCAILRISRIGNYNTVVHVCKSSKGNLHCCILCECCCRCPMLQWIRQRRPGWGLLLPIGWWNTKP